MFSFVMPYASKDPPATNHRSKIMTANKNLPDLLRCLDYPGISDFSSTDFGSVASLLAWLVQHLNPSIEILGSISSDVDRQHFLDGIAGELSDKMNIIVSTSALFAAGSLAENELIKVATVLYQAVLAADDDNDETSQEEPQLDAINGIAQSARSLVNEIIDISLGVSSRLRSESNDTEQRAKALEYLNCSLSSSVKGNETSHIESSIDRTNAAVESAVERLDKQCKIALSNGIGMQEKIRKKTMDLERTKKRLEGLDHIRPAYMDEYEQLEEELQVEYERYVVRLRNEDYLKGELTSLANETEKHHEHEEEHTEEDRIL